VEEEEGKEEDKLPLKVQSSLIFKVGGPRKLKYFISSLIKKGLTRIRWVKCQGPDYTHPYP
jgi:hypothetical protein